MSDGRARYFAFGDLHGHHRELMALYHRLLASGMDPDRDTLVFLGDHVDSGPDSRRVVSQLMAWQIAHPHWIFLMGNHEELLLNAREAWASGDRASFARWWTQGGEATWRSYLLPGQPDPPVEESPFATIDAQHVAWLEQLPRIHVTPSYVFVHAGVRPGIPLADNDPDDLIWIRDEFIQSDWDWGKRVIYGHTPVTEPLIMRNKIGLNTLPRNVGKLTVVELIEGADPDEPVHVAFVPAEAS